MTAPDFAAAYIEAAEDALRINAASSPAPAIRAALNIGVAIAISLQETVDLLGTIDDTLQEAASQLAEINDGLTQ